MTQQKGPVKAVSGGSSLKKRTGGEKCDEQVNGGAACSVSRIKAETI